MRALAFALLLLALPLAQASHPSLTIVSARLDSVFDPTEELGFRYVLDMSLRNDGALSRHQISVREYGWLASLPPTLWSAEDDFQPGETRRYVAPIECRVNGCLSIPGIWWFFLDVGGHTFGPERGWSVWYGTAMPNGVVPEDMPHWQWPDTPMGDTA